MLSLSLICVAISFTILTAASTVHTPSAPKYNQTWNTGSYKHPNWLINTQGYVVMCVVRSVKNAPSLGHYHEYSTLVRSASTGRIVDSLVYSVVLNGENDPTRLDQCPSILNQNADSGPIAYAISVSPTSLLVRQFTPPTLPSSDLVIKTSTFTIPSFKGSILPCTVALNHLYCANETVQVRIDLSNGNQVDIHPLSRYSEIPLPSSGYVWKRVGKSDLTVMVSSSGAISINDKSISNFNWCQIEVGTSQVGFATGEPKFISFGESFDLDNGTTVFPMVLASFSGLSDQGLAVVAIREDLQCTPKFSGLPARVFQPLWHNFSFQMDSKLTAFTTSFEKKIGTSVTTEPAVVVLRATIPTNSEGQKIGNCECQIIWMSLKSGQVLSSHTFDGAWTYCAVPTYHVTSKFLLVDVAGSLMLFDRTGSIVWSVDYSKELQATTWFSSKFSPPEWFYHEADGVYISTRKLVHPTDLDLYDFFYVVGTEPNWVAPAEPYTYAPLTPRPENGPYGDGVPVYGDWFQVSGAGLLTSFENTFIDLWVHFDWNFCSSCPTGKPKCLEEITTGLVRVRTNYEEDGILATTGRSSVMVLAASGRLQTAADSSQPWHGSFQVKNVPKPNEDPRIFNIQLANGRTGASAAHQIWTNLLGRTDTPGQVLPTWTYQAEFSGDSVHFKPVSNSFPQDNFCSIGLLKATNLLLSAISDASLRAKLGFASVEELSSGTFAPEGLGGYPLCVDIKVSLSSNLTGKWAQQAILGDLQGQYHYGPNRGVLHEMFPTVKSMLSNWSYSGLFTTFRFCGEGYTATYIKSYFAEKAANPLLLGAYSSVDLLLQDSQSGTSSGPGSAVIVAIVLGTSIAFIALAVLLGVMLKKRKLSGNGIAEEDDPSSAYHQMNDKSHP